ncbi:MAG: hypothetical protein BAJALOKI1v1_1620001 [Promethearchaeota archaeon]|nr:MAG: hypothetical protein BAJALOKI1v1_1620001 [Candidatus Lokiarchaeota archaeon]
MDGVDSRFPGGVDGFPEAVLVAKGKPVGIDEKGGGAWNLL